MAKTARQEHLDRIKNFNELEAKLKALKSGQRIYQTGSYGDIFEHEVVSIDLENMRVNTLDHSLTYLNGGTPKPSTLGFWYSTVKEAGY